MKKLTYEQLHIRQWRTCETKKILNILESRSIEFFFKSSGYSFKFGNISKMDSQTYKVEQTYVSHYGTTPATSTTTTVFMYHKADILKYMNTEGFQMSTRSIEGPIAFYMSLDAETDGLWGTPFSIGAILYAQDGEEISHFYGCLPTDSITDPWTIQNVVPLIGEATHDTYESLISDFSEWYIKNKDTTIVWHMGHIVEAFLFREMHRLGNIGDLDAPYTPIEVSEVLRQKGYSPDSVDNYVTDKNIHVKKYSGTHNPLYDAEVAFKAFYHLTHNKCIG